MDAHKNLAVSSVATAPSPATSGTSLVVASGEGSRFPATPFNATVWPANARPDPANAEIVRVTGRSTDTLTITRAQESSSARTVIVGDLIAATITAKSLTDIEVADAAAGTASLRSLGKTATTAASGSDTEFAFSTYKDVRAGVANVGSAVAANTFVMAIAAWTALAAANSAGAAFYLDPADYSANRNSKLRVKGWVITNAVAPGINFIFHLYPVATWGGGSNVQPSIATVGASLGSVAINAPALSTQTISATSDITFPSAGWHCLACVTSGTTATNSIQTVGVQLQVRQT